jgi:hypothetical protein
VGKLGRSTSVAVGVIPSLPCGVAGINTLPGHARIYAGRCFGAPMGMAGMPLTVEMHIEHHVEQDRE